jgi:acyl-CoA oxidase
VLKSLASWHGVQTIQECREACGGNGYISANQLDALKEDADIFTTFEGDNYVLLQLVSKGLLTEFNQSFHEEGFRAVIRFLGSKMRNTIAEINPYYARMTNTEHLLDRNFHMHAFRYREKKTLLSLAGRMQDYLKKRINPYDAFLMVQNHMVDLAIANGERLVLRYFVAAIEKLEDSKEKEILNKLSDLYALSTIEREKGFYLETGYMEGSKTKAIRRMNEKLCQEIKPFALDIVNSFGIPDHLLKTEMNGYEFTS